MYSNSHIISTKLRDVPIADTGDGASWAIKALHPADHEAVPRGVPTYDSTSVVNVQYQTENLFEASPAFQTDTWNLTIYLLRDPIQFAAYIKESADGSQTVTGVILNDQIGLDRATALTNLESTCEAYRISYAGATGHLVAPALADQGTVRAAQYEYPPFIRPYLPPSEILGNGCYAIDAITYPDPMMSYSSLIQMPNAYQNNAREGFYMPLKLQEDDLVWTRTNQRLKLVGRLETTYPFQPARDEGSFAGGWPFYDATANSYGYMPGSLVGQIAFRGISTQAGVNVIFRYGVDMKVRPATTFSPFNHEPPVYDAQAIKMYFEIARRMADAYPASYNATGKLLQIVGGIAQQLWPIVAPHAQKLLDSLMNKIKTKVEQVAGKKSAKAPEKPKEITVNRNRKGNPAK